MCDCLCNYVSMLIHCLQVLYNVLIMYIVYIMSVKIFLELCNEENVTSKLWATANAIMEGMKLKTQPKMDAMMAEAEAKRRREQGEGDIPEDDFSMADESTDDDLDVEMGENLDSRIIATRETVHRFPRDEGAGHSEEGTADESSSTKEEL